MPYLGLNGDVVTGSLLGGESDSGSASLMKIKAMEVQLRKAKSVRLKANVLRMFYISDRSETQASCRYRCFTVTTDRVFTLWGKVCEKG